MNARDGLVWLAKAALIYIALTAGSIAGGLTFYRGAEAPDGFDAAAAQRILFMINAAYALMLAALAARTKVSRIATGALLFALFFGVQTVLTQMEAVYFADSFNYPTHNVLRDSAAGALTALFGAVAAALLFKARAGGDENKARPQGFPVWRFAFAVMLYPVAYWTAGLSIAWQSEAVREFYNNAAGIEPGPLLAFQIFRGAMWAGLALAAVRGLREPGVLRAVFVGAAFALFMAAQLFYPNPLMPEIVRMVHLVEIGISNFAYGLIAALLLAPPSPRRSGAGPHARTSAIKA